LPKRKLGAQNPNCTPQVFEWAGRFDQTIYVRMVAKDLQREAAGGHCDPAPGHSVAKGWNQRSCVDGSAESSLVLKEKEVTSFMEGNVEARIC
jgi:hypothetical protein